MKPRTKWILAIVFLAWLLAFGGFYLVTFTPLAITLRQNPGLFNRSHLDSVVSRVRSMPLVPGQEIRLRLESTDDLAPLRLVKPDEEFPRGSGAGTVWAMVTKDGKLAVTIETRDLGHAGEYGFAYSDIPLSPRPFGGEWFTLDVPGQLNLVRPEMKIDEHWWKVVYNLD